MHFSLELAADTEIIGGQYPQIQKMRAGYEYDGLSSVYKLGKCYQNLPDFTPDLDGFVLHSRAKQTDFLSSVFTGTSGFIVSEKAKSILQEFYLPTHAFYKAKVYYRKKILENYFWFHLISDLRQYVDYPSSTFFIYKDFTFDLGNVKVSSCEDLISKRLKLKQQNIGHNITIWGKRIKFVQNIEFDLFHIGLYDANNYVSSRLQTAFQRQGINGISIEVPIYGFRN